MRPIILLLMALMLAAPAAAVEVSGLYQGDAFVTGQDERERPRGLREALRDVLIKVSGDPQLAMGERANPILARAEDLVTHFSYEDRMKHLPLGDEQGTRDRPFYLTVDFDPAKVDQALAGIGLKPLGADRPLVLVVLWVKTAFRSYGLAATDDNGTDQRDALLDAARRRGVALVLPSVAEAGRIDEAFIAPANQPTLDRLAEAHQAQAVLSGSLVFDPDAAWRVRWRFVKGAQTGDWRFNNVTFDQAMRGAMNGTLAAIADKH